MCNKCGKIFTQTRYLRQHQNRTTPCDKKYICKKCGKSFPSSGKLRAHENRKTPCAPEEVPVIKGENTENRCHLCNNTYVNSYSLRRHQRNGCPMKNNQNALIQLLIQQNEEARRREEEDRKERQLLREAITNLGGQLPVQQVTNNNVTVNQVQNNLYLNVTICSFGNEDLSKLDTAEVMKLLQGQVEDFMPKMIEHVHANPKHPEHHNVFYDPEREKAIVFAPISETEMTWQMRDIEDVSDNITKKIKEHIRPGSGPYFDIAVQAKDTKTANNIPQILSIDFSTDEAIEKQKDSLSKVTKNKDFMNIVEVVK
jgi:hypothetical protein